MHEIGHQDRALNCKYNIITYPQTDYETPKKYFKMKTLQSLLLWIFTKNTLVPLWLTIHNKSYIRVGVVIHYPQNIGEGFIKQNSKTVTLNNREQLKTSFWQNLFFSKFYEESIFIAQKPLEQQFENMELQTYKNYDRFTLTEEQLKFNLYPLDKKTFFDYVTLQNKPQQQRINIYAIDCEMVQTDKGLELARITMVDFNYQVIMDELVMPPNQIKDYNTKYSGITEEILKEAKYNIKQVQEKLQEILDDQSILIGHSLENDLNALQMMHHKVIDTSVLYMTDSNRKLALKVLAQKYLNLTIQKSTHDSVEDAKIALSLARLRIDIFDHFPQSSFTQQNVPNPDILLQLKKFGGIQLVEQKSDVEQYSRFEIGSEDVQSLNDEEKIIRIQQYLKQKQAGAPNPKLIMTELKEQMEDFDGKIQLLHEQAPQHTLLILSYGNFEEQGICFLIK
ncbi:hypothetical protein pb186bvf_001032 [Paramecium bursaria]